MINPLVGMMGGIRKVAGGGSPAGLTFNAYTKTSSANGNFTVTLPTNAAGDLIVVAINRNSFVSTAIPSGWSLLTTASLNGGALLIYYKVLTAPLASVTFAHSTNPAAASAVFAMCFSGAHATNPLYGSYYTSNGTGAVLNCAAGGGITGIVVRLGLLKQKRSTVSTYPSATTHNDYVWDGGSSGTYYQTLMMGDEPCPVGGFGTASFTVPAPSAGSWSTFHLLVQQA